MKIFKELFSKNTKLFFVTILTSMIAHFELYSLVVTGPDTLINSMYHQADIWEVMLLRFGLDFVQSIKGNIVSPILSTLISSIFLAMTIILVINMLDIKNSCFQYIIAVIFAVAPNISATLTFFYCSDAYMLGMLLATLSVYLIRKYEYKNWIILLSGLFLSFAMGMYQTYLSVTMVLCLITLLIDAINKVNTKHIFIHAYKYVLVGILGIILFYIFSHIKLYLNNLSASSYSGANSIGFKTLLSFPQLLPEAYQSFFNYFFNDTIIPNTIWHTNILYIIVFSVMIISIVYIIIKNKVYEKKVNLILSIIFILLLPLCFGIIEIIVPDVDIHILMACSMIYVFPLFFKILEFLPSSIFSKILKYTVVFCSLIIIWNYTWQDNASYIAIKSMQNQAESTVLRIVTQIEDLDGFYEEIPVLFLGGLENNSYLNRFNTSIEAKKVFDRSWGFISTNSTIWWGNLDSWRKILYEYTGVNLNLISESECTAILQSEEYKSMNFYPNKDSIKIINNTVVVKLSN